MHCQTSLWLTFLACLPFAPFPPSKKLVFHGGAKSGPGMATEKGGGPGATCLTRFSWREEPLNAGIFKHESLKHDNGCPFAFGTITVFAHVIGFGLGWS